MRKVYVVTEGDYSDYNIKAVFSTRALANAYIVRVEINREIAYIEEYGGPEEISRRIRILAGTEPWDGWALADPQLQQVRKNIDYKLSRPDLLHVIDGLVRPITSNDDIETQERGREIRALADRLVSIEKRKVRVEALRELLERGEAMTDDDAYYDIPRIEEYEVWNTVPVIDRWGDVMKEKA